MEQESPSVRTGTRCSTCMEASHGPSLESYKFSDRPRPAPGLILLVNPSQEPVFDLHNPFLLLLIFTNIALPQSYISWCII